MSEVTQNTAPVTLIEKQLQSTVKLFELTLGDWVNIAMVSGYEPLWGFYRWTEMSAVNLKLLSRSDWDAIAEAIDREPGWAYYQHLEHKE